MTVKELKEKLNEFDENLEVRVSIGDLQSSEILEISKSKPCTDDDEEGEELTRDDVVWLSVEYYGNKKKRYCRIKNN